MKEHDIDIIGLCQTRINSEVTDREVKVNGYNIYLNDRNRNGGGVALYIVNI